MSGFCHNCKHDRRCDLCDQWICSGCACKGKLPFTVICYNCSHIIDDVVEGDFEC